MKRILLTEGQFCTRSITDLSDELEVDPTELLCALYEVESYLCKRLSIGRCLTIERDQFMFRRISGVFPVSECLEVEVRPKFLNGDESWRIDFLVLLAQTRWGLLSEQRMLQASRTEGQNLGDVMAMAFLALFETVSYIPIRVYRRNRVRQFDVVGELEEESVLTPSKDGFLQVVTELSRKNAYNAIISEAANILMLASSNLDLRARLERAIRKLGKQDRLPAVLPYDVPARYRQWAELLRLSVDILNGYGIDCLSQGDVRIPSFVVRTSDAWEELMRQALVNGLPGCSIAYQEQYPFAQRNSSMIKVRPDFTVQSKDGKSLLVDAKYKYSDAKSGTISNADIYEGWAFMRASNIRRLVLLYPFSADDVADSFTEFQRIRGDNYEIVGVRVSPRDVSEKGLCQFGQALAEGLNPLMIDA